MGFEGKGFLQLTLVAPEGLVEQEGVEVGGAQAGAGIAVGFADGNAVEPEVFAAASEHLRVDLGLEAKALALEELEALADKVFIAVKEGSVEQGAAHLDGLAKDAGQLRLRNTEGA